MAVQTPHAGHEGLGAMASRYVDVDALPWEATRFPGVEIKILMQDPDTGMMTSLTRLAPGAELPDHTHVGIEQSFVLEGTLVDDQGACTAGDFVWRPAGSRHAAHSPDGAWCWGFSRSPTRFMIRIEELPTESAGAPGRKRSSAFRGTARPVERRATLKRVPTDGTRLLAKRPCAALRNFK